MGSKALSILMLGVGLYGQNTTLRDLTEVSLEDLMNIRVTSVSKKEQKLSKAGAAIFVVTQEDIQRSGATNIPDLLRMVPGVNVAQIDAARWAISIRGFNTLFENKVLVLIDGRSVYSPDTSAVNWDQQDVPLEDIERIEVIRGAGGTVWGANAVNGVINIISKSAKASLGGIVTAQAGSQDSYGGLVQYGDKIGKNGAYRVFGNYFNIGGSTFPNGSRAGDGWHMLHAGFRSDWDISPRDSLTVQGDLFGTSGSETINTLFSKALQPQPVTLGAPSDVSGGNFLGRWDHKLANGSDISVLAYYNRDDRTQFGIRDILNTVDFDFQDHLTAGARHDIVWGAGYRVTAESSTPGYSITLLPLYPTDHLFNTFVQDEIKLSDSIWLTVGSKFEHNTYTGFEYEPSAQLVWAATPRQTIWASAARTVRQPARLDGTAQVDYGTLPLPGGGFGLLQIESNRNLKAEHLRDFEAGYRAQINPKLSLDVSTFLSFYSRLRTQEPGNPFVDFTRSYPLLVIPIFVGNRGHGKTYGGEVFANWNATPKWRISPGYSYLGVNLELDPGSQDRNLAVAATTSPRDQFQIRSFLNLTRHLDWDASLAYTGILHDGGDGGTPSYTRVDTRLGWRVGESGEFSLIGQNLLTGRHREFTNSYPALATLVERKVFARMTWRF